MYNRITPALCLQKAGLCYYCSIMVGPISELLPDDERYPPLLREISGAPKQLFFLGNPKAWERPLIAIVGTRKASAEGIVIAKNLSERLVRLGIGIVSGLALGIDGAAHDGALRGNGTTIAVLGNGLGRIYPRTHESLAKNILMCGGAIVSEYPSDAPPYPAQFLERNRIISGLSLATIVIEAPEHSGSLATARHAMEQGREVFVYPGPAHHPNYRGSHWLIREGARLVSSFEDIAEDLSSLFANASTTNIDAPLISPSPHRDSDSNAVMRALIELGGNAKTEHIIASSQISPEATLATLAFLVIEGELEEKEDGFCIKR